MHLSCAHKGKIGFEMQKAQQCPLNMVGFPNGLSTILLEDYHIAKGVCAFFLALLVFYDCFYPIPCFLFLKLG